MSVPYAKVDPKLLRSGRHPCPACNRKELGYAAHPHAQGWKDYERASCRYCNKTFSIKEPKV